MINFVKTGVALLLIMLAMLVPDIGARAAGSQAGPDGRNLPALLTPSTTTITSSANPCYQGQNVTFTAKVTGAGGTPSGTLLFLNGAVQIGLVDLSNGQASFTLPCSNLLLGSNTVIASYLGDIAYLPSLSTNLLQTVQSALNTVTSLVLPQSTSPFGAGVTLNATVAANGLVPTGNVTFYDGTTLLGTGALVNGKVSLNVGNLAVGAHTITAVYGGVPGLLASTSLGTTLTIQPATPSVALTSALNPSTYGQSVTFNVTVSGGGSVSPTGVVTFLDGSTTLGTGNLVAGATSLTLNTLAAGGHSVTALYGGDSNFQSATSAALTETVNQSTSAVALLASPNPATAGQAVSFTASVTSPRGTPTGTVTFKDGATTLGTANLTSGAATLTTSALSQGGHSITATYNGSTNLLSSVSAAVALAVNPSGATVTSSTTLSVSPNPVVFGQAATFTVTVTGTGGTPTGTVTFQDGSSTIGSAPLTGGSASLSLSALGGGSHSITATYGGDGTFLASTSAPVALTISAASSTIALISSPNPSTAGQAVSFTATVTGPGGTATGTVTFKDGSTTLGTSNLANGVASFTSTALTQGSHSITALYNGSSNLVSSVSSALSQTINPSGATVSSTTTMTVTPNPVVYGQPATFTVAVTGTGGTPTGTITIQDGSTTIGSAPLVNGTASVTIASIGGGSHSLTATYSGDGTFIASTSAPVAVTVNTASSSASLIATPNPASAGQAITFTATITGPGGPATGTVTFKDGTTTLGTSTLTAGVAAFTTASLTQGDHSITAVYSGSTNLAASTSSPVALTIKPSAGTTASTTMVAITPNPAVFGQPLTVTVTVMGTGGTPTGTISVQDGMSTVGTATLVGGTGSVTIASLGGGSHSITAIYGGDSTFVSSTSAPVTLTVSPASSTTTLDSSPNPSAPGQPVTFTATVTSTGGTARGTITFTDGSTTLGTSTLANGTASLTVPALSAGSHSVVASYGGSANFQASSSAAVSQTVQKGTSTVAMSSSANPSTVGAAVTLSVTVSSTGGTPTGTVTFKDGTTTLATVTLANGTASFSTTSLTAGSHVLTAAYSGNGNIQGGVSVPLVEQINQSTATLVSTTTVTASPNPSNSGQSVTFTATVAGSGGSPTGSVAFTDGATALGGVALTNGSASFSTASLAPGNHQITAVYSGDAHFLGSRAAALQQTVDQATITTGVYSYAATLGVTGVPGNNNAHFSSPRAGAVDSATGRLFISDSTNQRIQVYDTTTMNVVATIGVPGSVGTDTTHFNLPGNLGFDPVANKLYVADTGNQRVQIFDGTSYAYVGTLGTTGTTGVDNSHFNAPSSARLNPLTRQLYVADQGNARVQVYDADSLAYIATLGTPGEAGSDNTHLKQPNDIDYNSSTNQVLVSDGGNSRLQVFDATSFAYNMTLGGAGPGNNSSFALPDSVAFDPVTNLVLVADAGSNARVQVFDAMSYNYVMTLGTAGTKGSTNSEFAQPVGVTVDAAHQRVFIGDSLNDRVQVYGIGAQVTFASVLPGSRSVALGTPATVFATVINAGSTDLTGCQISAAVTAPAGLALSYQTTDPATNALTGTPNTPVTIAANNGVQSFLISYQGSTPFDAPSMPIDFDCAGAMPATVVTGVDTVDLLMSSTPVADIIALSATPTANGVISVPAGSTGAFAVASTNIGVGSQITVSVDTGSVTLPVNLTLCQSNPSTGQCLAAPTASVNLNYQAGTTPTFSVFAQATGTIPFAPATNRVFVRFEDASGDLHGSTSVAVQAQ